MTQLDLFGAVLAAERQQVDANRHRRRDALICLRDSVPNALELIAVLDYQQPQDARAPHLSGKWAYCPCRAGLRFESQEDWGPGARARGEVSGWDRTPARLITWAELATLIGDDPRRADIIAWRDSLPEPRWQLLTRPHELWPHPETWHPSYIKGDHAHEQWPARRRTWQLVLDLLDDAITAVVA